MDQAKQKSTSTTARNFEEASELIKTVIVSVSELIPLFMDKLAILRDKPEFKELKHDLQRFRRQQTKIGAKVNWLYLGLLVLFIWNISLTLIVLLQN